MSPDLIFTNNKINNVNTQNNRALIHLYGTQLSVRTKNNFINANNGSIALQFEDAVRAKHLFNNNNFFSSGKVIENKFVERRDNIGIKVRY